jgi:hypothetical protein
MHARTSFLRAAVAVAALSLVAAPAGAQAFGYPAFQMPRVASREFNFAIADGDDFDATSLVFQWRASRGSRTQLSLDLGYADTNADGALLLGGQFARQLATSSATAPFDVLLTVGANIARIDAGPDNTTALRVPVGVSAGHVFPIEGGMTITPYIHPRFVIAHCDCLGTDETNLGLEFDIGGEFKFSPAFAVRLSAGFGDADILNGDSFGVSLAWTPGVMSRSRR